MYRFVYDASCCASLTTQATSLLPAPLRPPPSASHTTQAPSSASRTTQAPPSASHTSLSFPFHSGPSSKGPVARHLEHGRCTKPCIGGSAPEAMCCWSSRCGTRRGAAERRPHAHRAGHPYDALKGGRPGS